MKQIKSDKKITKQVRIDKELHRLLKTIAKTRSMTVRSLLEEYVVDGLDKDNYLKI